jgi:hypothetical protein
VRVMPAAVAYVVPAVFSNFRASPRGSSTAMRLTYPVLAGGEPPKSLRRI